MARVSNGATGTMGGPVRRGLVRADPTTHARASGAMIVRFDALRAAPLTPRRWLETVAAFDGASSQGCRDVAARLLDRAGLQTLADRPLDALSAFQRCSLAIAEVAARSIGAVPSVVVPSPPMPLPARRDLRVLAIALLHGRDVVLAADDASELSGLVAPDAIVDGDDRAIAAAEGASTVAMRVWAPDAAFSAWIEAISSAGAKVEGAAHACLIRLPATLTPSALLAAAHDHDVDVLELTLLARGDASV